MIETTRAGYYDRFSVLPKTRSVSRKEQARKDYIQSLVIVVMAFGVIVTFAIWASNNVGPI